MTLRLVPAAPSSTRLKPFRPGERADLRHADSPAGFQKHMVSTQVLPASVLARLYEIADDRRLPAEVRGGSGSLRYYAKARHRLSEPERPVDRASDREVLELLWACKSASDRLIVLLLAREGCDAVRPWACADKICTSCWTPRCSAAQCTTRTCTSRAGTTQTGPGRSQSSPV